MLSKKVNFLFIKDIELFDLIGLFLLILSFLVIHLNLYNNLYYMLDSDISSELCYSNFLYNEHSFISKNYHYSTEIRIFNSQLVFVPLFYIFKSWKIVRIFGTVIGNILLISSFWFMCKKLKIKHIQWLCILLIFPISKDFYDFTTTSLLYTFYLIISFITIGLFVSNTIKNRINIYECIILLAISFVSSIGSIRQFVVLYLPLFLSTLLLLIVKRQNIACIKKEFKLSSIMLLSSLLGYFFYKCFLKDIYTTINNFNIVLKPNFNSLPNIVNGWASLFGYNKYINMTPIKYISVPLLIIILILTVFIIISKKINRFEYEYSKQLIIVFFILSSLEITSIFIISSMNFTVRYLFSSYVFFIPVVGILLEKINIKFTNVYLIILFLLSMVNSTVWMLCDYNDDADDFVKMSVLLIDNETYEGYAPFWSANVIREISGGIIDTWCYGDGTDFNKVHRYQWLQEKEKDITSPSGRIFIIIENDDELLDNENAKKYCIYKGEHYSLFVCDDDEIESFN